MSRVKNALVKWKKNNRTSHIFELKSDELCTYFANIYFDVIRSQYRRGNAIFYDFATFLRAFIEEWEQYTYYATGKWIALDKICYA